MLNADARRIDEDSVRGAAGQHLDVPGDDRNTGQRGRLGAGLADFLQCIRAETLFQNETRAETKRFSPADRQIVRRAVNGERADVSSGEEDGIDDIGIRGEADLSVPYAENRAVFEPLQTGIPEMGKKHSGDQIVRQPSAAWATMGRNMNGSRQDICRFFAAVLRLLCSCMDFSRDSRPCPKMTSPFLSSQILCLISNA